MVDNYALQDLWNGFLATLLYLKEKEDTKNLTKQMHKFLKKKLSSKQCCMRVFLKEENAKKNLVFLFFFLL
jgi:hypothetical protein